jgi:hypothetical protein
MLKSNDFKMKLIEILEAIVILSAPLCNTRPIRACGCCDETLTPEELAARHTELKCRNGKELVQNVKI